MLEIKSFVQNFLRDLYALEIDVMDKEQELIDSIMGTPSDMLEDFGEDQIRGLLLDDIGYGGYSDRIYSFDMEAADVENMYSVFLEQIAKLTRGDLVFEQITESLDREALETGEGIHTIRFWCGEKEYEYHAKAYYDWFDATVISFINQVIAEYETGKCLLVCSDGGQICIVFYETEEWGKRFNEIVGSDEFQVLVKDIPKLEGERDE